jgi:PAS domain S-box-containing protein
VQIALVVAIVFVLLAGGLLVRHTRSRLHAEKQASEASTALMRSEAAYRDQAVRLASILDNVVDGIITINESGSIESWSKGAQRLFGYEAGEVLRRNVKVLMPEPHQSAHDGYLRRYVQTGERRIIGRRIEAEALTKSGERVPIDLGISELRLGDRRLFIGIVRDISERLEVERLKAGFVSTVSHELRTPLTSIAGSLGLLAGGVAGALPPKASRLIDIAKLNCERLVLLINDILDLERAESGSLELRLEQQPLKPIVQHAIELNRSYAHNFAVSIELDPLAEDAAVLVDRDRLIQVLTNLLSNAAKFSPRGGLVRVSIQSDGDSARVSVLDKGPGISADFKDRIFRRFAQADSSDSRAKSGTGLGLSIAKATMEKLGGAIGFESEPGEGSMFYITLPVRQEMRAYPQRGRRSTAGPHVLICEDDPDIAQVFLDTLQSAGMRVRSVPTARQARAALTAEKFDIALVDLHLPDADGLEFIAELRVVEATRALPIIVVTASGHARADTREISALELADWLQKPVDPRRLLDAIHNVVAQHRAGRARILHVEDDESLTQLVHELLDEECDVTAVHTLADAKLAVRNREYHLVILDIGLGDGSGLDILPLLRRHDQPAPPVILYSATEASREVSEMVEAALVKSRHPVEQLLASVRALVLRASQRDVP